MKGAVVLLLGVALVVGCGARGKQKPPPDGAHGDGSIVDGFLDRSVDGEPEASLPCTAGETRSCYTGPTATKGVGGCKDGVQTCAGAGGWGSCTGEVLPAAEICDNKDNNCDGHVDEALEKSCYTGPSGTEGVGECKAGKQTCSAGSWGSCVGPVVPVAELCDGKDNNCDGKIDEGLTKPCYGGPAGTQGVGDCKGGTQTCAAGNWGECVGQVQPSPEVCDNHDNNCSGQIDEALSKSCYTGPPGTENVGLCKAGTQSCSAGSWGACKNQVLPAAELCDDKDNNCNGQTDEGLTKSCYTGPPATSGVGECKPGQSTCSAGVWGSCQGEVLPLSETCDGKDNNCNGQIDEGVVQNCYTGPPGTSGVGECKPGKSICTSGSWGACQGQVLPSAEICDGKDNNCSGQTDEGLSQVCYTGPAGTLGKGICKAGTQTCSNGSWGSCLGEVIPGDEYCDGQDNDCNGQTDEICGCTHGICETGNPLLTSCGPATAAVCAGDAFCCTWKWDSICVSEVRTKALSLVCAEAQGSCAHTPCTTGAKLVSGCDSSQANCVTAICTADSYCCDTDWDDLCVAKVSSVCGKNCNLK